MNKLTALLSLLFLLPATSLVHAQGRNAGLQAIRRSGTEAAYKATEMARQITAKIAVQRPLLRPAVLTSLEPNIHRFIFTVTPRGAEAGFKGSGFVFADKHQGKTVLWGASAAHTVRHMGKDVTVTFHLQGQKVSFPATIELTGRKFGVNAALIKLPEEVAQVALPFEISKQAVAPKSPVFTYGFSDGTFKKTVRSVLVPGSERLMADFPRLFPPKPGFCGSVVLNEKGQAVGIETGGYDLNSAPWMSQMEGYTPLRNVSRISEIVPAEHLNILLREHYTAHAGDRVLLLQGMKVGTLGVDEFIDRISVHYKNGAMKIFEHSPLWEPMFLDQAITHLEQAQTVDILINKNRLEQYVYHIDFRTRSVTREEL